MLADSFARIFFRNAVNLGLVPVVCKGVSQAVKEGQTITLDLDGSRAGDRRGDPLRKAGEPFPERERRLAQYGLINSNASFIVCPS